MAGRQAKRAAATPKPGRNTPSVALDTGGTFTDCVWVEKGRLKMLKVFSTPADPSQAIVEAVERTGLGSALVLLHGTTVGTNSLLQRRGARVAFVTTEGFEDSIQIGRQARPKLYDFFFDPVEPLVPPELRFGVRERTACEGEILERPSESELRRLRRAVQQAHPESVAVSLLFSFVNPENERAVAGALAGLAQNPVPLSLAHLVLPEFREYERASTVVVNAYLQPLMQRYLENLAQRLQGRGAGSGRRKSSVFIMQSSGGITSLAAAAAEPVRTVLSGPAGGVVGAAAVARRSGFPRIVSFDMGGTSTDVALVDGEPRASNEAEVAGLPVRVPMLDIHTVGAGGGSIARFDAGGALRVGPLSAGADPGPICYGKGDEPTVTDANLLLGRLPADKFLGGEFPLDAQRARRVVKNWLHKNGSPLSVEQFAAGVIRVVNATMEKAVRVVSIERGYDPRDFTLVAFGGAGGMHACELAAALGIPRVLLPPLPGALSAYGILVSDLVKDYSRTVLWRVSGKLPLSDLRRQFRAFERQARAAFRKEKWSGAPRFRFSLDLRYRGQGYELNVPFGEDVLAAFHREHQRRYGYSRPHSEVEIVTLRLRALLPSPSVPLPGMGTPSEQAPQRRPVIFDRRSVSTPLYERASLAPRRTYRGPAIVTEYGATTVVPPGFRFRVDRNASLIMEKL
ncbi:MAG TPA: hydantoinase/oxoprolinase family protein [Terriglobales bacterium]|jgi:N-methylhydantoinase A|nr:hydantoinase/oxoprolinase family protein [Terriglobales bacterium]